MKDLSDFPDAPDGSYVCDEGWLIINDEAWTEEEWRYRRKNRAYKVFKSNRTQSKSYRRGPEQQPQGA
jgi:hypothetical protein